MSVEPATNRVPSSSSPTRRIPIRMARVRPDPGGFVGPPVPKVDFGGAGGGVCGSAAVGATGSEVCPEGPSVRGEVSGLPPSSVWSSSGVSVTARHYGPSVAPPRRASARLAPTDQLRDRLQVEGVQEVEGHVAGAGIRGPDDPAQHLLRVLSPSQDGDGAALAG